MNRVFLTNVVPKEYILKSDVSVASNNFSYSLIDNQMFDSVISLVPPNISAKFKKTKKIKFYTLNNKNIICTTYTYLRNIIKIYISLSQQNIWFYNLTRYNLLLFFLLEYFSFNKTYLIFLDHTPPIKSDLVGRIIHFFLYKFNGVISLRNLPKFKNCGCICGFYEKKSYNLNPQNKSFIFSGILSENRLPELLFRSFINFPDLELHITGKIENKIYIDKYVNKYDNIYFHGYLSYKDYESLLSKVTFSLNFRDPVFPENSYNFPSKSIEHLGMNKVLISTIYYDELENIEYVFVDPSKTQFYDLLKLVSLSKFNYSKFSNQSKKVNDLFGKEKWSKTFLKIEQNDL
jgi:hypothetical protein